MENYFTLPKIMTMLRSKGIAVFGTSCFKKNWPPDNLKNLHESRAGFHDFYHMTDEHETLTLRWMDNGLVFCVSTIHKPGEIIKRTRKRPRKTKLNSRHVDEIFGKNGKAEILYQH